MKLISVFAAVSLLTIFIIACKKDKTEPKIDCGNTIKSYSADVAPAILSTCTTNGCHNSGSNNGPGALITYQQVFNARVEIRSAIISRAMPLSGSLAAPDLSSIVCWIDAGAPNN